MLILENTPTNTINGVELKVEVSCCPVSQFLLPKGNHRCYHFHIFLLVFYAYMCIYVCISTYPHISTFSFLTNSYYTINTVQQLTFFLQYILVFACQCLATSFFLIAMKCFIIWDYSFIQQMFNVHLPCVRPTSRH